MKKMGFTLSEVIVALGIIAVIAAITAPLIGNIIPDKNKITVLKAYKIINDTTAELLETPALYRKDWCNHPTTQEPNPVMCVGLGFVTQPVVEPYNNPIYSGTAKYPLLFASKLDLKDDPNNNGGVTFTTVDGINWIITDSAGGGIDTPAGFPTFHGLDYRIDIDINGDEEPNCSMCKNADQYSFDVRYDGIVSGIDDLTKQYLATADKLNNKKEDYKAAGIE